MTLEEDIEGDCCDEELSEAQVSFYKNALKEYDQAISEANSLKKGSTIIKQGNLWTVKSTFQVKIQNANNKSAPSIVQPKPISTVPANIQPLPVTTIVTQLQPLPPALQPAIPTTFGTAVRPTGQPPAFIPVRPVQLAPPLQPSGGPRLKQLSVERHALPQPVKSLETPMVNIPKQNLAVSQTSPQVIQSAPTTKLVSPTQPAQPTVQKKQAPSSASSSAPPSDDPKVLSKSIPSLCVVVKTSKSLPEAICQKKRETLDSFVKSRLVLDPQRFADWLMQAGLVKTQQFGICRYHNPITQTPLQLKMYDDTTRFPNSGGYVWITKCCDKNFVSIFRDSIFEDSVHPPTVLLKLIYHWACQTPIHNVIQWVKVEHAYIRSFFAMLRSVCTVEIHTSTPVFGLSIKNNRVEVGVISLGTTSTDGQKRDVKVEVLGVFDQESRKFRLRASEPVPSDSKTKARFARILEPLPRWVSKKAHILTDHTIDRSTLSSLGFVHISQKTLSSTPVDDPLSNRHIMDYLRRVVPKMFQTTLSLLSTATIQQFLDELVWRETHGQSHADAFHSMMRDLGIQSRAETGSPLVKRLPLVAADPFKDWGIITSKTGPIHTVEPTSSVTSIICGNASKRPAPILRDPSLLAGPRSTKEPRNTSYYGTMHDIRKEATSEPRDAETFCQLVNCKKVFSSNLEMMEHIRQHISKETAVGRHASFTDHCNYCLSSFSLVSQKIEHEEKFHTFISSFKHGVGRDDAAIVKDVICLICHEVFPAYRQLEQHLEKKHVHFEMPYHCRVCNFAASSHSLVINHFLEQHKNSSHLLCPLCLETFSMHGDNLVSGDQAGHVKYFEHMKHHVKVPTENRPRCKRCVLTFTDAQKLQSHLETDHITFADRPAARPFTFSVIKPQNFASKPPAVAAVVSPPLPTSPTHVGAIKTIKTYTKEPAQETSNMTIARRFNLTVSEEPSSVFYLCIECKDPLRKKNHFQGYLCCSLCKFSTCCTTAMRHHQNQAHKPPLNPMLGTVFALDSVVQCQCGFTTREGLEVEKHMLDCGSNSVIVV